EIGALAEEMDHSGHWAELVDSLRERHPVPDELLDTYRSQMERAREFVVDRDLASIPDAPLEVIETPAFLKPLIPYAAYQPPGALSNDLTGTFYVTVPGPDVEQSVARRLLRDHCLYEIPATALHEGYPGHHLHLALTKQSPSLVRRVVASPLTVEGWALYCEDMMAEQGFYSSVEERLFQKVQLLWRAVRIVVDVGLHTMGMTIDEAVDMLVDRAGLERANAESEVRRYCGAPAYQLCYAVGRRDIKALREAYRHAAGGEMRLREFHDRIVSYGGLPLSLIRWGMGLD
ncbi:MAG: DUF885 domain-containing protein, partial [Gemmatimonadales bacterium]